VGDFGGGFYGLIALLTFIIIELTQVVNFLFSITGWQNTIVLFSFAAKYAMRYTIYQREQVIKEAIDE